MENYEFDGTEDYNAWAARENARDLFDPAAVEQERLAAEDRAKALPEKAKRFTARKRSKSAVLVAAEKAEAAVAVAEPTVGPAALSEPHRAVTFILAGNAYFTVRSLKTGVRYTFRVSKAAAKEGGCNYCRTNPCRCPATWFVALLSGPENTTDYVYMGMIRRNQFNLTRASKFNDGTVPVQAFRYVWGHLTAGRMPPQTEIWHEGRCGRCGRMLTVPESIAAGIGPECAGKL